MAALQTRLINALKPGRIIAMVFGGILLNATTPTVFAANAEAGKAVFKQCAACHMLGPDAANRFGPPLNGVMVRGAGVIDSFDYSPAFDSAVQSGLSWSVSLDAYLAAPMAMMPGTKMAFPGLASAEDRVNVIAYLATFNEDGSRSVGSQQADVESANQASMKAKQLSVEQRKAIMAKPVPTHGQLHLGRKALVEEVAAWDIDVRPDGEGLPAGEGTVEQGGVIYDDQCAACHGVFGEGEGRWPVLAGGQDTLSEDRPLKTIGSYWPYLSTVFDYVRRAMPFGNARSLSDDDVYAVTAYLLYLNDLVDESFELNQETYRLISMPNERGFIEDTRQQEASFNKPPLSEPCMKDCFDEPAVVLQTARILDVTPEDEN